MVSGTIVSLAILKVNWDKQGKGYLDNCVPIVAPNTMCQKIYGERDDGAITKSVRPGRQRLTGQTRQLKLLNLYQSKPSPENNSNSEIQGGQMNDP